MWSSRRNVPSDHCASKNCQIHFEQGFAGSFASPWAKWSWVIDADPVILKERTPRLLYIKGSGKSTLSRDSPVPFFHHDPSDLGSIILHRFIHRFLCCMMIRVIWDHWSWSGHPKETLPQITVQQRNWQIHSEQGFTGSFASPWSKWSRINYPYLVISKECTLRSLCIKGNGKSTLSRDSPVPLLHHDPSDLGSSILIWSSQRKAPSGHCASKELSNPLWTGICRFLCFTMSQVILSHWIDPDPVILKERTLRLLYFKGSGESTLSRNSPVTLLHDDPGDLGSLILIWSSQRNTPWDHCASKEPVNPLWAGTHRFL